MLSAPAAGKGTYFFLACRKGDVELSSKTLWTQDRSEAIFHRESIYSGMHVHTLRGEKARRIQQNFSKN